MVYEPTKTMACILMSCLSAHTPRAVPLISRASVVQLTLTQVLKAGLTSSAIGEAVFKGNVAV